jgi:hypothetical protein
VMFVYVSIMPLWGLHYAHIPPTVYKVLDTNNYFSDRHPDASNTADVICSALLPRPPWTLVAHSRPALPAPD